MENGSEKLFLLEFLVDKVSVEKTGGLIDRLSSQNEWGNGEMCVTFQFLDYPHLEICEQDFVCKLDQPSVGKANFKSGKSCLFAVPNSQLETLPDEFEVNVGVLRRMPTGVLPDKLLLAQTKIPLSEALSNVINDVASSPQDVPVTRRLRECFSLLEPTGVKVVGSISVFVRLTCFGKLIVTPFQLGGVSEGSGGAQFGCGEENKRTYECVPVRDCAPATTHVCEAACHAPVWEEPCQLPPCRGEVPVRCCGDSPAAGLAHAGWCGECRCIDAHSGASSVRTRRKEKPCQEIGAEINGHALTIRVRKNKAGEAACPGVCANGFAVDDGAASQSSSSCPCGSPGGGANPSAPGFFVQLPQRDGKPLCYRLRNCPSENQEEDCIVLNDKPRDNFVLRIGKGKSHVELELQTPKKEGPRPLAETSSRETQYMKEDAGPGDYGFGRKSKGKKNRK